MHSDFIPELTDEDQQRLDGLRLQRLRDRLPKLRAATLFLGGLDRKLIVGFEPGRLPPELNLADMRIQAWILAGVDQISLYDGDKLILETPTLPKLELLQKEPRILESNSPLKETFMATATQEKTRTPRTSTQTIPKIPQLTDLEAIASRTSMGPEEIAAEIVAMGGTAFADNGTYKATDLSVSAWLDTWLDRDREQRKQELLNGSTSNPETNGAASEPTPSKRGRKKAGSTETTTPKPRTGKTTIKDFKKSTSYAKTLDNFMSAQKWEDGTRNEIVQAIGNLLDDRLPSSSGESLAERCVAKILTKYPSSSKKSAYAGILEAARKLISPAE